MTDPNTIVLTYIFNTDGASVFQSSKRAIWPIFIILNELPPKLRFRHTLSAGLLLVKNEPSSAMMNTYLQSFVNQAKELSSVGFKLTCSDGKVKRILVKPLLCSVDTVARPILQNRVQFNGYYGCSWCYDKGKYEGGCMRFLIHENEPDNRTHDRHMRDMVEVITKCPKFTEKRKNRININGVKGFSVLTELPTLDMIWSFVRDYMHADLLGIIKHLWSI